MNSDHRTLLNGEANITILIKIPCTNNKAAAQFGVATKMSLELSPTINQEKELEAQKSKQEICESVVLRDSAASDSSN